MSTTGCFCCSYVWKVDSNMLSVRDDLSNVINYISVLISHIFGMKTLNMESSGNHNTIIRSHSQVHIVSNNAAPAKPPQTTSMPLPLETIPPKNLGIAHLGQEQFYMTGQLYHHLLQSTSSKISTGCVRNGRIQTYLLSMVVEYLSSIGEKSTRKERVSRLQHDMHFE
jgi:hypothetical protein